VVGGLSRLQVVKRHEKETYDELDVFAESEADDGQHAIERVIVVINPRK
jgi:hypothetical protein